MPFDWNAILVIVGALLILTEVALGGFAGFDLVLTGSAILLGGAVGLLLHSTTAGFAIAAVLSVLYIAVGRRWVRRRMQHRPVSSNTDALIGLQALVTQRIETHAPGQVRVRDEVWRAMPVAGSGPFEAGALVTVQGVDGVTLQVR